jgi:phosphoglucosamine mutase
MLALKRRGQSLAQARQGLRKCPQVLLNVRFAGGENPVEHALVQAACARVTSLMGGRGRVLLRKSGTEPLVRVMVEGDDEAQVRGYAEELVAVVEQACA